MQDGVELVEFPAIGEDDGSEAATVDRTAWIEDVAAELGKDFFISRAYRLNQGVRDFVGLQYGEAVFAQHRGDRALAAGDASGQTIAQHERSAGRGGRLRLPRTRSVGETAQLGGF